jgi:hypothetical protein
MRSLIALPALLALATAQFTFEPIETEEPLTSIIDLEPTATETGGGPVNTGEACAQISEIVSDSSSEYPNVAAEVSGFPDWSNGLSTVYSLD